MEDVMKKNHLGTMQNEGRVSSSASKSKWSVRTMVIAALFTSILCMSAYISIPLPNGSHITMLNFVITLIALLFPLSEAVMILTAWYILGIIGIPVFIAGNATIGYLIGPLGGYTFSFMLVAILLPLIRGKKYHRVRYTVVAIFSVILVDVVGTFWLMFMNHMSFLAAFLAGFVPYILLDIVKAVVAAHSVPAFLRIMRR